MTQARLARETRHRLGQYFTPDNLAEEIIRLAKPTPQMRILEPSFGDGSFIFSLLRSISPQDPAAWCASHLDGCEIDGNVFDSFRRRWQKLFASKAPASLRNCDFFRWEHHEETGGLYDLIIGNPPFGAAFDPALASALERRYGTRNGFKIKKESYAFFIVRSLELLAPGGTLLFICSDTILSIRTMEGLRRFAEAQGKVEIHPLPGDFSGTLQKMILLRVTRKPAPAPAVTIFGHAVRRTMLDAVPNHSWLVQPELARYFGGETLGDYMEATAGMTTGNNELFLREIRSDGTIREPYEFVMRTRPVTLQDALKNARNGKLGKAATEKLLAAEAAGKTVPDVTVSRRSEEAVITLPSPDYAYYNKADNCLLAAPPKYVIFWRDNGNYVYTYKKNGPWYLHGVGGRRFFGRPGITWPMIGNRIKARMMPPGYIFDCGAPAAFLRPGIQEDTMYFILGWCLTELCNALLK